MSRPGGRAALAVRVPDGPRVRVAALMTIEGRVVVVRHRSGPSVYHLLPGGGVDYRETVEHALVREVREETGLAVSLGPPVLISDTIDPNGRRHVVNITFLAKIIGGSITESPDDPQIEAVELVAPSHLEHLDLRPPMAAAVLRVLAQQEPRAEYLGSLFSDSR